MHKMADMRTQTQSAQNREFWTEFFLLYESLPALWNTSAALYKERAAKIAAYDVMVEKLRELEPNADREDVLRKINIFRTNFRREISRINTSNRMGKQYRTTLWYFDLLSFLQSQESKRSRRNTPEAEKCIMPKRRLTGINTSSSYVVKKARKNLTLEDQVYDYDDEGNIIVYDHEDPSMHTETHAASSKDIHFQNEFNSFSISRTTQPKIEQHELEDIVEEIEDMDEFTNEEENPIMERNDDKCIDEFGQETETEWRTTSNKTPETNHHETVGGSKQFLKPELKSIQIQTMPSTSSIKSFSEASEILAKSWAIQYDEMADDQKIYARKAIADILFDGCMGNLGTNVTPQPQIPHQQHEQNVAQCIVQQGPVMHEDQSGIIMGNERTLLKRQHVAQPYDDVVNDLEECYVFDNGRAIKIQDWALK